MTKARKRVVDRNAASCARFASVYCTFTHHVTLAYSRVKTYYVDYCTVMSAGPGHQSVAEFLSSVLPVSRNSCVEDDGFQRPLVTLTFAQSLDGKIAGKGGKQLILSGRESMLMTHWYDTGSKAQR